MSEHYEHDAQDYRGLRPRDLDEALSADFRKAVDGIGNTSAAIDNIKKKTNGIWVVAVALVAICFEFGVWVTNYNRNAQDGSPALVKLKSELMGQYNTLDVKISAISAKDDSRYDKLSEILTRVAAIQEQQGERLNRMEDRP
jgi:hypothetical protein